MSYGKMKVQIRCPNCVGRGMRRTMYDSKGAHHTGQLCPQCNDRGYIEIEVRGPMIDSQWDYYIPGPEAAR